MNGRKCLACRTPSQFSNVRERCQFTGGKNAQFLNNQLWTVFILRKLFHFSRTQCENILRKSHGRRNPSSWFVFCCECTDSLELEEAWNLHKKIVKLEHNLREIGERLKAKIRDSCGDSQTISKVDIIEKQILKCIAADSTAPDPELPETVIKREVTSPVRDAIIIDDYFNESSLLHENIPSWTIPHDQDPIEVEGDRLAKDNQEWASPENLQGETDFPIKIETSDQSEGEGEEEEEDEEEEEEDEEEEDEEEWIPVKKVPKLNVKITSRKAGRRRKVASKMKSRSKESVKKATASLRSKNIDGVKRGPGRPRKYLTSSGKTKGGNVKCSRCPTKFRKSSELAAHLKVHEKCDEMSNEFDCKVCGYPCESERHLRHHTSHRHEVAEYKCDECGYLAPGKARLARHKKKHAFMIGSKMYQCDVCEETFENYVNFTRHRRLTHAEELKLNIFKCDKCDSVYTTNKMLQDHILHFHEHKSKYSCEICGRGLMSIRNLKAHLQTHETKKRSEICYYCGADFLHWRSLRDHIRKFHSENKKPEAEKSAAEKEEIEFKCKYCEFTSPFRHVIMRHRKIHSNVFRHLCDICGNEYTKTFSLKLHKQIAHGDGKNVVKCEWCQKSFVHYHYLRNHLGRCKMRPAEDKARALIEKPKQIRKASLVVVKSTGEKLDDGSEPSKNESLSQGTDATQPAAHSSKLNASNTSYLSDPSEQDSKSNLEFDIDDNGKRLTCKYCGVFQASTKGAMFSHCVKMHKDQMDYKHKCDECGMKYTSATSLTRHKDVSHPGDRGMIPCKFCMKFFRHWSHLRSHYKICKSRPEDEPIPDPKPPKEKQARSVPKSRNKTGRGRGRPRKTEVVQGPSSSGATGETERNSSCIMYQLAPSPSSSQGSQSQSTSHLMHETPIPVTFQQQQQHINSININTSAMHQFPIYNILEQARVHPQQQQQQQHQHQPQHHQANNQTQMDTSYVQNFPFNMFQHNFEHK